MYETTLQQPPPDLGIGRPTLWFAFLGGGVAWTAHLLLIYVIAEFGCVSPLKDWHLAGLTAVTWLVLLVSLATAATAAVATFVAWRLRNRMTGLPGGAVEHYMALAGLYADGLFLFFIIVQAIPIFFYLHDC